MTNPTVPAFLECDNFSDRAGVPAVPEYRHVRSRLAWGQGRDGGQHVFWPVAVPCAVLHSLVLTCAKLTHVVLYVSSSKWLPVP